MRKFNTACIVLIIMYLSFLGGAFLDHRDTNKTRKIDEEVGYGYGLLTTAYDYGLAPDGYVCEAVHKLQAARSRNFVELNDLSGYSDLNNLCEGNYHEENNVDNDHGLVSPRAGNVPSKNSTTTICTETSDNCT